MQLNLIMQTLKASTNKEAEMFLENSKAFFAWQDSDFVSSTYVALGSKWEITWETLKKYWIQMFPEPFLICVPKQRILKMQNLHLRGKNVLFLSYLLIHTTLLGTLAQNVSVAMFPCLHWPLAFDRLISYQFSNDILKEIVGSLGLKNHLLKPYEIFMF